MRHVTSGFSRGEDAYFGLLEYDTENALGLLPTFRLPNVVTIRKNTPVSERRKQQYEVSSESSKGLSRVPLILCITDLIVPVMC